jgi:hypothetical protein
VGQGAAGQRLPYANQMRRQGGSDRSSTQPRETSDRRRQRPAADRSRQRCARRSARRSAARRRAGSPRTRQEPRDPSSVLPLPGKLETLGARVPARIVGGCRVAIHLKCRAGCGSPPRSPSVTSNASRAAPWESGSQPDPDRTIVRLDARHDPDHLHGAGSRSSRRSRGVGVLGERLAGRGSSASLSPWGCVMPGRHRSAPHWSSREALGFRCPPWKSAARPGVSTVPRRTWQEPDRTPNTRVPPDRAGDCDTLRSRPALRVVGHEASSRREIAFVARGRLGDRLAEGAIGASRRGGRREARSRGYGITRPPGRRERASWRFT